MEILSVKKLGEGVEQPLEIFGRQSRTRVPYGDQQAVRSAFSLLSRSPRDLSFVSVAFDDQQSSASCIRTETPFLHRFAMGQVDDLENRVVDHALL